MSHNHLYNQLLKTTLELCLKIVFKTQNSSRELIYMADFHMASQLILSFVQFTA